MAYKSTDLFEGKSTRNHRFPIQYVFLFFHSVAVGTIWCFPSMGVPQNGWFIKEDPTKVDDD